MGLTTVFVCLPKFANVLAQLLCEKVYWMWPGEKVFRLVSKTKQVNFMHMSAGHDFVNNVEAMIETYQEMQ